MNNICAAAAAAVSNTSTRSVFIHSARNELNSAKTGYPIQPSGSPPQLITSLTLSPQMSDICC